MYSEYNTMPNDTTTIIPIDTIDILTMVPDSIGTICNTSGKEYEISLTTSNASTKNDDTVSFNRLLF